MNDKKITRDRNLKLVSGVLSTTPAPTQCEGLALLQRRRSEWKGHGSPEARRIFHALDYYCDVARWAAAGGTGEAPRLALMGTLFSDGKIPREAVEVAVEAARLVGESK